LAMCQIQTSLGLVTRGAQVHGGLARHQTQIY
jgi:hypothetical protein